MKLFDILEEGVTDVPPLFSLEEQFDIISYRVDVAKRALGIANRLKNSEDRKKHRGTVLRHLNALRAMLARLYKQIEAQDQQD